MEAYIRLAHHVGAVARIAHDEGGIEKGYHMLLDIVQI
jgi:hypothetical protein